jgi:hypothetical protein
MPARVFVVCHPPNTRTLALPCTYTTQMTHAWGLSASKLVRVWCERRRSEQTTDLVRHLATSWLAAGRASRFDLPRYGVSKPHTVHRRCTSCQETSNSKEQNLIR